MTAEEAAMIMMSGSSVSEVDPRIKKLESAPAIWAEGVADGWNIRVKIASDIDNMQYFQFGSTHHGIVNYITQWTMYYCVYYGGTFKYASCFNPFWTKYQENYQNADVPNRLYFIDEYTDFLVTSGSMDLYSGGSIFLNVSLSGTYIYTRTNYSWTDDADRIKGDSYSETQTWSSSRSDFGGSQYNGNYIVNGSADDFKNSVYGLYAACLKRSEG